VATPDLTSRSVDHTRRRKTARGSRRRHRGPYSRRGPYRALARTPRRLCGRLRWLDDVRLRASRLRGRSEPGLSCRHVIQGGAGDSTPARGAFGAARFGIVHVCGVSAPCWRPQTIRRQALLFTSCARDRGASGAGVAYAKDLDALADRLARHCAALCLGAPGLCGGTVTRVHVCLAIRGAVDGGFA